MPFRCPGLMEQLELDFVPSNDESLEDASAHIAPPGDPFQKSYGLFYYSDTHVEQQFCRFLIRDSIPIIFGYGLALGFPLMAVAGGFLDQEDFFMGPLLLGMGAYTFVFASIYTFSYLFHNEKYKNLLTISREFSVFSIALGQLIVCSWALQTIPRACESSNRSGLVESAFGIHDNENMTNVRQEKYCVNIVRPFLIGWAAGTVVSLRQRLPQILFLYVAAPIVYELGRLHPDAASQSAATIGITAMIHVLTCLVFLVQAFIREFLLRKQFEQHWELLSSRQKTYQSGLQTTRLLTTMLDQDVLLRLMRKEKILDHTEEASVCFVDIANFTAWSSTRSAREVATLINYLCVRFDSLAKQFGVVKIKTIGDSYWAVLGLPRLADDHAETMLSFVQCCLDVVKIANEQNRNWGKVEVRAGIHSGPLSGCVLGSRQLSYEVFGLTNGIAEQIEQNGAVGGIVISKQTANLLGEDSNFDVRPYDELALPGYSDPVPCFLAVPKINACSPRRAGSILQLRGGDEPLPENVAISDQVVQFVNNFFGERRSSLSCPPPLLVVAEDAFSESEVSHSVSEGHSTTAPQAVTSLTADEGLPTRENDPPLRHPCLPFFRSDELETEYQNFVWTTTIHMVIYVRFVFCVFVAALCVGLAVEQPSMKVPSFVLIPLGIVLLLLSSAMVVPLSKKHPYLDLLLLHIALSCEVVGFCLIPDSIISRDPTCFTVIFAYSVLFAQYTVWALFRCILMLAFIALPATYFILHTAFATLNMTFLALSVVMLPAVVILERGIRQTFLDQKAAVLVNKKMELDNQIQNSIVGSVVPKRLVCDLLKWHENGMNTEQRFSRHYDCVVVLFIRFDPVSCSRNDPHHHAVITPLDLARFFLGIHDEMESLTDLVVKDRPFEKIKTVGNVLLYAGPLHAGGSSISGKKDDLPEGEERDDSMALMKYRPSDAARAALELCHAFKNSFPDVTVRCGIHAGPLVATVIGTQRLAFDVFGDTVNTASRLMTTTVEDGEVACSEELKSLVEEEELVDDDERTSTREVTLSPFLLYQFSAQPFKRHIKGKGLMDVYACVTVATGDAEENKNQIFKNPLECRSISNVTPSSLGRTSSSRESVPACTPTPPFKVRKIGAGSPPLSDSCDSVNNVRQ